MSIDIEYHIEGALTKGLRAVFLYEDEFKYDDDDKETKVFISPAYPRKDEDFKIAQICIVNVSYQLSENSLFANYYGDIVRDGAVVGYRYATHVPYSVQVVCVAQSSSESKDLSNKVLDHIMFSSREIFSDLLRLNIKDAQKSSGGFEKYVPQDQFTSTISLSGSVHWVGEKIHMKPNIVKEIESKITRKEV